MSGNTSYIEAAIRLIIECICEGLTEARAPVALKGQQSPEDARQRLWGVCAARVRDRKTCPMKAANAGHLFLRVFNLISVDRLLGLEHGVDAFSRNDDLAFIMENEGRVLPIEYHNIDLLTERAVAVNDMGRLGVITPRQVGLEQLKPHVLARIALCAGMSKCLARCCQAAFYVIVKSGQQL